ncbi:FecR family protein [Pedobacter ghigonis]|uniref:FecR family protein n=1 Tax=Pedobacter ghigonis TaxID=2730403 RepID=UPI00158A2C2E|nr:FecR family protein [Pedobacter ghigonis]
MSPKEFDQHLLELLTKFKNGEATAAEIREIDLWYENQASNSGYTDMMPSDERFEAKQKILQRINTSIHQEAKVIKISPYKKLKPYAIAASLLFAIGVAFYFKPARKSKAEHNLVIVNDIAPGNNKATLTLANGKRISLANLSNGEIASQSGIRISKTDNGQLVYESVANTAVSGKAEFNTIEVPVGGQWQVILPDRSKVWLNALSSITYPLHFSGKERNVKISGEAYFEVAHNSKMPFKVQSGQQTVEVLGTHFNVMAYADEQLIKTTLMEGSVKVYEGKESKLLVPGEQAQVGSGKITVTKNIDVEDVVAWKNGYFKFDENLESIMAKVARWYNVEIVYQVKPDPGIVYAGKVSRTKNISSLLKIIEFDGDVHFKIDGRRVIVMK